MVWLADETWDAIQASVPVVCVDLFPVLASADGDVSAIGLIRRHMPGAAELVWCPIGGRISHGETLRAALLRHLDSTLSGVVTDVPADPQPAYVFQWFPTARADEGVPYGVDPRRHSVGLCFVVPVTGEPVVVEGGEAVEFRWFELSELEIVAGECWPGTAEAVRAALAA